MMKVRIGTRSSPLALYQADLVSKQLVSQGIRTDIVKIQSAGDIDTKSPLHKIGSTGVFTKALNDAILDDRIDIAVHSCKDLPTENADDLEIIAYLKRGPYHDLLVYNGDNNFLDNERPAVIATGSIRRRAQWKRRFPDHRFEELRGNIATRLDKLKNNPWNGIILSEASIKRLNYPLENTMILDWMIPAPAQGVIAVVAKSKNSLNQKLRSVLNHGESELMAIIERRFLNTLEGGCSAPIGALVIPEGNGFKFRGILSSNSGDRHIAIDEDVDLREGAIAGEKFAEKVLSMGGNEIMKEIKSELEKDS